MKSKSSGFTIIELLVVISIVGITLAIGLPSYTPMISKVRLDGEISAVVAGLNFARSEAQKRGLPVVVCPTDDGSTCSTTSKDWSNGWIVLLNDTTPQLLQSNGPMSKDKLTSNATSTPYYPQFTSMGYTFFTNTLKLQDAADTPSYRRCLVFGAGNWTLYTGTACQ